MTLSRSAAQVLRIALQRSSCSISGFAGGVASQSAGQARCRPAAWAVLPRPALLGAHTQLRGFADGGLPPHQELGMPSLSPTMNAGNIAAWKKKEGDEIVAGDVLAEIETDKATMEWEAQEDGYMARILVDEGAKDVSVGTPVAVTVEEKDDIAAFADYSPGSGGGGGGGGAAAAAEAAPNEAEEAGDDEEEPEEEAEPSGGGGGGGSYPAHTVLDMPALSPTMSQGNIAAWKKAVGDSVAAGDSLAEIETDKATMDWESQEDGFVAAILQAEGAKDVPTGEPCLVMVEEEGDLEAFKGYTLEDAKGGAPKPKAKAAPKPKADSEKPKPEVPAPSKQPSQQQAPPPKQPSGGRVVASPYARKLAQEAGVDISQATASGPDGRIVAADVKALIESGGASAPSPQQQQAGAGAGGAAPTEFSPYYTDIPNSQIRKVTARRLLESKQSVPHYYLTIHARVDKLAALRAQLNEQLAPSGAKLSINDFVVKAAALALRKVPEVNASWFPDYIRQYHNVDVSVAVQTPSGLMVPIIRDTDALGLKEISAEVKALAGKAKEGKLAPHEYQGGTFTISNLGMYGVNEFSAIINPPQSCILAVGSVEKRVVAAPGGGFQEASLLSTTLSCDHRVVDGALGAQWLQAFRGYIEDPVTMLL